MMGEGGKNVCHGWTAAGRDDWKSNYRIKKTKRSNRLMISAIQRRRASFIRILWTRSPAKRKVARIMKGTRNVMQRSFPAGITGLNKN
jgi:hypothetical protein